MRKNQRIGTDEQLRYNALLPKCERPYEIPENWVWTKLETLVYSRKEKCDDFSDNELRYIGLEHIQSGNGIVGYGSVQELKSLKNVFKLGDIWYGKLRPYLNKHDIASFDGICSTDILVLINLVTKYLNYGTIDAWRILIPEPLLRMFNTRNATC